MPNLRTKVLTGLLAAGMFAASFSSASMALWTDGETSTDNALQLWTPTEWLQTTQASFEAGVLSDVDTTTSPGDVTLTTIANWYDPSWGYRKRITITTGATPPQNRYSGYTVEVTLDTTDSSRFQPDCDDLRILYWNGSGWVELDRHIIDPGTVTTRVRFQLQTDIADSSSDNNYHVYYKNPTAGAGPANLGNVYLWYDSASTDGYADYTKGRGDDWHGTGGTDSFAWNAAGYYTYDTGNNVTSSFRVPSATLSERDAYIEAEFYHTNAYPGDMTSGLTGRYQAISGYGTASESADHYYATNRAWSLFENSQYSHDGDIMRTSRGTVGIGGALPASAVASLQWRKQAMAIWGINPTNGKFWDNDVAANMDPPGWPGVSPITSGTDASDYEGSGEWGLIVAQDAARIRSILVRRYTEPEPSTGLGAEDEEGAYVSPGTIASQVLDTGSGAGWYDAGWSYRRAVTIDRTKVQDVADPSTTYANFPVLVYATGLSNIKADGADIRFTSSDGTTELPREIESYSAGTLYAWVKVTLTKDSGDSSDDVIYVYYGNGSATEPPAASTYGSENVWDSSYQGVWHLKEDPGPGGAGDITDSTSNSNDGTAGSSMTSGDLVDTQVYKGFDLDGGDDYVDSGMASNGATNVTLSAWFKSDDAGSIGDDYVAQRLVSQLRSSSSSRVAIGINDNRIATYWYDGGHNVGEGTTTLTSTSWYYATLTYDGANVRLYLNGTEENSWPESSMSAPSSDTVQIGRQATSRYLDGLIDEVRVSSVARPAAWIKTEHSNQSDPSGFYSIGTEAGQPSASTWVQLSWTETLPANTDITFEVRASDTLFAKGDASPSWTAVGGISPVTAGLPSGRYMQWRATLTTSDGVSTPSLHSASIWYY